MPPEKVEKAVKEASEFFRPRKCKEQLDSDDPSNAETPSTIFNANQETILKNVTEGLINPPAFEIDAFETE